MKFDWSKIEQENTVVNCETREQAIVLFIEADKKNYKWWYRYNKKQELLSDNEWYRYKKDTCYRFVKGEVLYGYKPDYEGDNYKPIKFEDVVIKEDDNIITSDLITGNTISYESPSISGRTYIYPKESSSFLDGRNPWHSALENYNKPQKTRWDLIPEESMKLYLSIKHFLKNDDDAPITIIQFSEAILHYLVDNTKSDDVMISMYCYFKKTDHMELYKNVAEVLTCGIPGHGEETWKTVKNGKKKYCAAALRHLTKIESGEEINNDDYGLPHNASVFTNILFAVWHDMKDKNKE